MWFAGSTSRTASRPSTTCCRCPWVCSGPCRSSGESMSLTRHGHSARASRPGRMASIALLTAERCSVALDHPQQRVECGDRNSPWIEANADMVDYGRAEAPSRARRSWSTSPGTIRVPFAAGAHAAAGVRSPGPLSGSYPSRGLPSDTLRRRCARSMVLSPLIENEPVRQSVWVFPSSNRGRGKPAFRRELNGRSCVSCGRFALSTSALDGRCAAS